MWITRLLDNIHSWRQSRGVLREFQAINETEELIAIGQAGLNPVLLAKTCLERGDRDGALRHWKDASTRVPGYVGRSHEAVRVAIGLGLYDEADRLANAAQKRRPPDPAWFEVSAEIAEWRGDIEDAFAKWGEIRRRFPDRPLAWLRVAGSHLHFGRPDEAEAILEQVVKRFPDLLVGRAEYARLAEFRGNWAAALEQWNRIEEAFPASPDGVLGAARALLEIGRQDEAEARLKAARYRHPASAEIAIVLARHAMRRGDWEAAVPAWETIRERWPDRAEGYHGGGDALAALGRHAEAEQVRAAAP